ncbi:hypothetical protein Tco_0753745, partial [Tanacetum coccineum]
MSQRRLLASLQAPFLKEKKDVRFSALYLHQKRNLLVLDHSHQQIGKGNLLLDLQKLQKNPIFRISVDIRQNTNFVRAFTTSANVPSIYIQLFWNTLTHDAKTGVYSFQVNEHWLNLSADLLRKALNRWIIASQDETTGPSVHPEDATSTKMVHETLSHANAESGGNSEKVGSNSEQSHVALAGPNPEHMHDVFLATNWRHHIEPVPTATVVNASIDSTNTSVSTTITQDAPSTSHSLSSLQVHSPVFPQGVAAGPTIEDTSITQADLHPSPEWTIPPNDFPEPEHNWANAYATSYKVPEENKLQRKTYDIGSFIKWFCRRTGKKKLCKADLEGPTFNLVKAFHKNSVFLQFQMDECHKLLTNKVDLSNPEGH